jgi:hypothetical protein
MIIRDTRHFVLLSVIVLSLSACVVSTDSTLSSARDEFHEITSYDETIVLDTIGRMAQERTLYVFDIDNTLLESPEGQFIGSDQWYKWQLALPGSSPHKVECLLQMQGAAYYFAHLKATELGLSARFLRRIQESGKDVIALTARSPQFRPHTDRELERNGFDFSKTMPLDFAGFPSTYLPKASSKISNPRAASYQAGIAMLAGQHKGEALKDLLDRIGAREEYDFVVFFDDDDKNVNAVRQSFLEDPLTTIVFSYKAVDTSLEQYDLDKAAMAQDRIAEAMNQFERERGCDI